ncbi:MAG: DUF6502 family protein [Gammaproteobacteria bacterium]|nr:DUF6502 family protein [Gammaproteobacteria bacterium]
MQSTLQLLRPIARILIRHGISHGEFSELARHAFVQVAFRDFRIANRPHTVSRVSVLTGLSRKEVLRIKRLAGEYQPEDDGHINRAIRVINGWIQDPDFLDKQGQPLSLAWGNNKGQFGDLCKRYSGDITAGAVLDELIAAGAVEKTEDNKISVIEKAYVPVDSAEDKIEIMGNTVEDLLETLEFNLEHNETSRYQRSVIYQDLPHRIVNEFVAYSRQRAHELLLDLNHWLKSAKQKITEEEKKQTLYRTGFGLFYLERSMNQNYNQEIFNK